MRVHPSPHAFALLTFLTVFSPIAASAQLLFDQTPGTTVWTENDLGWALSLSSIEEPGYRSSKGYWLTKAGQNGYLTLRTSTWRFAPSRVFIRAAKENIVIKIIGYDDGRTVGTQTITPTDTEWRAVSLTQFARVNILRVVSSTDVSIDEMSYQLVRPNAAPTGKPMDSERNFDEDVTTVGLENIVVTETDGDDVVVTLTLSTPAAGSLTTGSGSGETYSAATGVWTVSGDVENVNRALTLVAYNPTGDWDVDEFITVHIEDEYGASPADGTIVLDVNPKTDAPTATNMTQRHTYAEDTASVDLTNIVVTDPDTGDTITVTLEVTHPTRGGLNEPGDSTYNATSGVWTVSGTVSEVNVVLRGLAFLPTTNNDRDTTISTVVKDQGGLQAQSGIITMVVTPRNDPPTATNMTGTVTYDEDPRTTVALPNIVVTEHDTGDTIKATLTLKDPAFGTLSEPGDSRYDAETGVWTVEGGVSAVNSALASVYFVPTADNDQNTSIRTQVIDEAGTGPSDGEFSLNVSPKNDAPTVSTIDQTQRYPEGRATVEIDDFAVRDADTSEIITATLTLSNRATGVLTTSDGATYSSATGVWQIEDKVEIVNRALAQVAFEPETDNDVSTTVEVSITDEESTPVTGTINLDVVPENDRPTLSGLPQTRTYSEGTSQVSINDMTVTDPDTGEIVTAVLQLNDPVTGTLTTSNGALYNSETGRWSIASTVGTVNAALAAVSFRPASNNDVNTTVSVSVTDGESTARTGTIFLNVDPAPDAPTATNMNDTVEYIEDADAVQLADIVVTDVDTGEELTVTLTLKEPAAGTLFAPTGATWTPATGIWTITSDMQGVNRALGQVYFVPADDYDVDTYITTHVEDERGTGPADGRIILDVTPQNDVPTASNRTQTKTYNEGDVSVALDDIVVVDPDSDASITATLVLAITQAGGLSTPGESTYFPPGGVWRVVGSPSVVNQALADVVFLPNTDWDIDTSLAVTVSDGVTTLRGTITLDVTPQNDPPTADNLDQTKSYIEGAATVALDNITVTDPDTDEVITATLTLDNTATGVLTTIGTATYNSETGEWAIEDTVPRVNVALAAVSFTPATDNDVDTHIDVVITDEVNDKLTGRIDLVVSPRNDPPTATNLDQSKEYTEGARSVGLDNIVVTDLDTDETITATLTLETVGTGVLTTTGGGTFDGTTWTVTGSVTAVNDALAAVAFNPNRDNDRNATVSVHITDGESDPLTGTIALKVNPVNDTPSATNLEQSHPYTEGAEPIDLDDIVVTDPDTGEQIFATLTLADAATGSLTIPAGANYNEGTGVWTINGDVATVNTALAALRFVPHTDNDISTSISVVITDKEAPDQTGSIDLPVTPVNDEPTATNLTDEVNYNEGAESVELKDIVVTDPDAGDQITATLTLDDVDAGELTTSGDATYTPATGVWMITSDLRGVNAALAAVDFIPAPTYDLDTFITTHVEDKAGTGPEDGRIDLLVAADNSAPTVRGMTRTVQYDEDAPTVSLAGSDVADVDTGDKITVVFTLSDPSAGNLTTSRGATFDAGVWRIEDIVATVNLALDELAFEPTENYDLDVGIRTHVEDAAGTGPRNGTITLDVAPSNDPPKASNLTHTASYVEGAASVPLTDIRVGDFDTGDVITATLRLNNTAVGHLTAPTGSTYVEGLWTAEGSLEAVNALLAAVAFIPNTDNDVDATITSTVVDKAGTGPAPGTITLDVTGTNDPPTAERLSQSHTYDEGDAFVALDDIVVNDVDSNDLYTVELTLNNPKTGALTSRAGGSYSAETGVWLVTGSLSEVNDALADVRFLPTADNDVNTAITTSVTDTAGTGPADGSITLNVRPSPDAPTATNLVQLIEYDEGEISVALADIVVTDPDTGDSITATLTLAAATVGVLTTTGGGTYSVGRGEWTVTGSVSEVNTALAAVAFRPNADNDLEAAIQTVIRDAGAQGPEPGKITLEVNPENDVPSVTNLNQVLDYDEGVSPVALRDMIVTDPDNLDTFTATLTVDDRETGALSTPDGSTYEGGVWTATGNLERINNALADVVFLPRTNNEAPTTITTLLRDAAGTGPDSGTITLNVNAENDPPTATFLSQRHEYGEGATRIEFADIVVADVDPGDTLTAELHLDTPEAGTLTATTESTSYSEFSGRWTVTGSLETVNTALAAVAFLPAADNDLDAKVSTTVTDDAGTGPEPGQIDLPVNPVNDAPTATNTNQSLVYVEGSASVAVRDIVISDVDTIDSFVATLKLAHPAYGSLSVSGDATYNGDTGVWRVAGRLEAVNAALADLAFLPLESNDQDTTASVHIEDSAGTGPADGTIEFDVTGTNDPPTATLLTQRHEYNEGVRGVSLDDIVVSDSDAGDRITATLTLKHPKAGAISQPAGSTYNDETGVWTATGSVEEINAILAEVQFWPAVDNDQNTSIATRIRDRADTGPKEGEITLVVQPSNDAPTATRLTQNHEYEEGSASVGLDDIVVTDPDTGDSITATLTLSPLSTGALSANGGATYTSATGVWTITSDLETVNAALAGVRYEPTEQNDRNASITTLIRDVAGTGPDAGEIALVVKAENDAPRAINLTQTKTYAEGTASVALDDIIVTELDTGDTITAVLELQDVLTGVLTTTGDATYDSRTGIWTVSGSAEAVNRALAAVAFTPRENNDQDTTILVRIRDVAGAGPNGSVTLDVQPANDPPQASNLSQTHTVDEGDSPVALDDIVASDVDTGDTITATLILSNPSAGSLSTTEGASYEDATGTWTVTGSVDDVNSALAAVAFVAVDDLDRGVTIATRVRDLAGTGPEAGEITVDIRAGNDAPDAKNLTGVVTYTEDEASVALPDIEVSDPDTDEQITARLTVAVTERGSLTGGGGTYSAETGVWEITGSVGEVNAALAEVNFVPARHNDLDVEVTTHVEDAAGAGPDDGAFTLTVIPVNDPPTATNLSHSVAYAEGAASAALDDIVVSDVDTDETITATLTLSNTATGALSAPSGTSYNGDTGVWTAKGSVDEVNEALAALEFLPVAENDLNAAIATHIEDDAGTGPADGTISLTVRDSNDPPTATNLDQTRTYAEGDSEVEIDDIVVADPDSEEVITATLTLRHPSLGSLSVFNGATYSDETGEWRMVGSVDEVNEALSDVSFLPGTESDRDTALDVVIEDALSASVTGTIELDVTPANDPPTATLLTQTHRYDEGVASVPLSDIVVSDPDTNDTITVTITLANPTVGVLTTTTDSSYSQETGVWQTSGSLERTNEALAAVSFRPGADNDVSTTASVRVRDAAGTGPDDGEIAFNVTSANDNPTATRLQQTKAYTEGDDEVPFDDIVVTDPDSGDKITAILTLADPLAGRVTADDGDYNADTGKLEFTGSVLEVNAVLASAAFRPATENDQNTSVSVVIHDEVEAARLTGFINLPVTAVNDVPVATELDQSHSYVEGDAEVAFDDIVVSDPDTDEIINVVLFLENRELGDLSADSGNGETYATETGRWNVTGSVAVVNAALADVAFLPDDEAEPHGFQITVLIRDVAGTGPDGVISLDAAGVNDKPTLTAGATLDYTEEDPATEIGSVGFQDPEAETGYVITVAITEGFVAGEDVLAMAPGNGMTASYEPTTGVLTLAGNPADAPLEGTLSSVTYENVNDENPSEVPRTVTYTVVDGDHTVFATSTVTVTGLNDAPVVDQVDPAAAVTGLEGTEIRFTTKARDPDGDDLTWSATGLPPGATINQETGEVVFTPGYEDTGEWTVEVTASDGEFSDARTFTLSIAYLDLDDDGAGDGLPDTWEVLNDLDPTTSDSDGDTISDLEEVVSIDDPRDTDEDETLDALDLDSDADGTPDSEEAGDADLTTAAVDTDRDEIPDFRDPNSDGDAVLDIDDNCRLEVNDDQADMDEDEIGDLCDNDIDGDGLLNDDEDGLDMDPMNVDSDMDNIADGEEVGDDVLEPSDSDSDEEIDALEADSDDDGIDDIDEAGDDFWETPAVDTDGDGTPDFQDRDSDDDGVDDGTDNCRLVENEDQVDTDNNQVGDACTDDKDGDGVLDDADNCELIFNPDQADIDEDEIGDLCDDDVDGDEVTNLGDNCELIFNPDQNDLDGDGDGDACDSGTGTGDVDLAPGEDPNPADGGCACSSTNTNSGTSGAAFTLLALCVAGIRRRRRRA